MRLRFNELRPLRLPFWVTFILAAVLPVFHALNNSAYAGETVSFLMGLLDFLFFCGILTIATLPFGLEFQYRTFGLLLAQPRSRWQAWKERTVLALLCLAICGLVNLLSQMLLIMDTVRWAVAGLVSLTSWNHSGYDPASFSFVDVLSNDSLIVKGAMLVSACSACFWTLAAGSVIGGMVFTFAGQVLGTTVVYFAVAKLTENENVFPVAVAIAAPFYCVLFLWLGWRKFARLELKGAGFAEAVELPEGMLALRWRPKLLRSTRSNKWINLVRKEVRLQRPAFMLTLVFVAGWTITALLSRWQPFRHQAYETVLTILTIAYVPIVSLLAGSVSIVDEKALGVTAWHLTFPVAPLAQWSLKLLVALGTSISCVLVPCLMYWVLPPAHLVTAGETHLYYGDQLWIALDVFAAVTIVSFWAATFSDGTVRATITTVLAIAACSAAAALGIWSAEQFGGLQTHLLMFFLPLTQFSGATPTHPIFSTGPIVVLIVGILILLMARSFAQFRRVQGSRRDLIAWCALILLLSCIGGFWCADFLNSINHIGSRSAPSMGSSL